MRVQGVFAWNADILLAAALTVGAVYFFSGYFATDRFDREQIEVRVRRSSIQVQGLYHYTNAAHLPAVLSLRVPFPVDGDHPAPDWFTLYSSDEAGHALADLAPTVRGGAAYFRLFLRPGEAKWIRLDYEQRAENSNGRYLLTTTRAWRRPIRQADYVLRLAPALALISSNYPVQPQSWAGPGRAYAFSKTDFYPLESGHSHGPTRPCIPQAAEERCHEEDPNRGVAKLVSCARSRAGLHQQPAGA